MATTAYKLDDGSGQTNAQNYFPFRQKLKTHVEHTESGAWLVAHNAEQRRRFKAILCSKPRTFEEIREHRKKSEIEGTAIVLPPTNSIEEDDRKLLDRCFLLKHCHIKDPREVCSINISDQGLMDCNGPDFAPFDSVAFINASENLLQLEPFSFFPELQELEIAVNGLRGIQLTNEQFTNLQMLDISFNNLSKTDILMLGVLPKLKRLNITGNNLSSFDEEMSHPLINSTDISKEKVERFPLLEQLIADDNRLSDVNTFTAIAGLQKLQYLSLAKNEVELIPHLLVMEGRFVAQDEESIRRMRPKSGRKSRQSSRMSSARASKADVSAIKSQISDENPTGNDLVDNFEFQSLDAQMDKFDKMNPVQADQNNISSLPPPFSSLTCINLSFNKISEERSLMAVAAWPKLQNLIIHDNPLTLSSSGEPPVLKKYLQEKLGIQVQRKKPEVIKKPQIEGPKKRSQKIHFKVPGIPHCDVDGLLLALEGPKPPMVTSSRNHAIRPSSCSNSRITPLPPIERSNSASGKALMGSENLQTYKDEAKVAFEENINKSRDLKMENNSEAGNSINENDNSNTNPIFMTEMGDMEGPDEFDDEGNCQEEEDEQDVEENCTTDNVDIIKNDKKELVISDKYKGYELLLDVDESVLDNNMPCAHDVNGNVKALKYLLNHPLIFRDSIVQLDKPQKPFRPQQKKSTFESKPVETRSQKTDAVLWNLRTRPTTIEAPLVDVLANKSYQKQFGDPKKLLSGVQNHYNRVTSTITNARKCLPSGTEHGIKPLFVNLKDK